MQAARKLQKNRPHDPDDPSSPNFYKYLEVFMTELGRVVSPHLSLSTGFRQGRRDKGGTSLGERSLAVRRSSVPFGRLHAE